MGGGFDGVVGALVDGVVFGVVVALGAGVGTGLELRVTLVEGVGTGSGSPTAVVAVPATTAASTADPAVTRIKGAQRTTHIFL